VAGRHLLLQLGQRFPAAVRILMVEMDMAPDPNDSLEVAHRTLSMPLETLSLVDAIDSVQDLRDLLDSPALKQAIGKVASLPAAPRQYEALTRLLRDPNTSAARVAEVVGQDPAVAAKVLRLTNSAYYSSGREITDLRSAVTRIGQSGLRHLVLASEVFVAGANSVDADALRERALRISRLAGRLLEGPSKELAATAGLLSEVGLLLPAALLEDAAVKHNHAGAYLLGLWGLPTPIVEAVAFQDAPMRLSGGFWVTGALHVANALINQRDVDEDYLRKVGRLDMLPAWQSMAQSETEAAAAA